MEGFREITAGNRPNGQKRNSVCAKSTFSWPRNGIGCLTDQRTGSRNDPGARARGLAYPFAQGRWDSEEPDRRLVGDT